MIFYFSAGCIGDDKHLARNNVENILISYFYITKNRLKYLGGIKNLLIDSGGFTAIKKGKKIDVIKYAQFLNNNQIKKAFTLDVPDLEESKFNLKYLEKNTTTQIIPIYHPSEYMDLKYRDLIKEYAKKYDYIGIGGLVNRKLKKSFKIEFLDYVFKYAKGVKLHGLGLYSDMYLKNYPFYSVDFTSWVNTRKYGCSVIPTYTRETLKIRNQTVCSSDRLDEEIQYILNKKNNSLNHEEVFKLTRYRLKSRLNPV